MNGKDGWFCPNPGDAQSRALYSRGVGVEAIYKMVAHALRELATGGGTVVDVGCGAGGVLRYVKELFSRYIGVDLVRYDGLPNDAEFVEANLNEGYIPLPDATGDALISVETIEHLENARALMREMTRLTKPGGLVVVTTPNQLSILSKVCFVVRNQHCYFRELASQYPAHITALLEIDLLRIARECELIDGRILYGNKSRIPGTGLHWPPWCNGRAFNDNIMLVARKASAY